MKNGGKLVLISNREPYIHERTRNGIKCRVPVGGLVTALDPVMQASRGVWVAWGSGSADMEVTDSLGRVRVPVDDPKYTLKRVWLTSKEVSDYYYGFSNKDPMAGKPYVPRERIVQEGILGSIPICK